MDGLPLQKVDLHCHSTASDGTYAPSALVEMAAEKGIGVFSLTDHDTVAGIKEASVKGREVGVAVIPGIEVTADTSFLGEGKRELHILGYHFDPDSKAMEDLTGFFQGSRRRRNRELLSRLQEKGIPLTYEALSERFGENFGKPNVAKLLVEMGYFGDRETAIDFLSSLGVKREKMDYREVISLIREAGGIAVIAHPVTLKLSYSDLYSFVKEAKDVGLEGLEVYHYRHKPADVRVFKEMCRDLDLYYTAGSDFHGENKPCVELGFLNVTVRDIRFPIYCSLFSL